jgi:hypothetical protein
MESYFVIWRLLLLLSLFVSTQLLGVLLYFRLARLPKWLAHGLCILGTTFAFFYLAPIFFFAGVREAQLRGPVGCGMPALAAAFLVLIGTGFQLFAAAGIHIWLVRKGRTANVPAS